MTRRKFELDEKHDDIFDDEQFKEDVKSYS